MKNEFIIAKNNHQIKVYAELIEELKTLTNKLTKFDSKVINIKVKKELSEKRNDKNISFSIEVNYNNCYIVELYNNNRSFKNIDGNCSSYIDNNTYEIEISEKNNKRLDINIVKLSIEKAINNLNNKIESRKKANTEVEEVEKEFKRIQKEIDDFKSKYHFSIREGKRFYI